jgi:hypothetical protein
MLNTGTQEHSMNNKVSRKTKATDIVSNLDSWNGQPWSRTPRTEMLHLGQGSPATFYRTTVNRNKPCSACYLFWIYGKLVLCFNWAPRHEGLLGGSGGIAPCTLWPRHWMGIGSFTPRPLYPQGKSPWYPLDKRLGGPQSRSGRGGEEKNSHPLPGLEPLIIQPVAQRYTPDLSRLLCTLIHVLCTRIKWKVNAQKRGILKNGVKLVCILDVYHHGMVHPRIADGEEGHQIWKVAVNILNKNSRTADKQWSSSLRGWARG